MSMPVSIFFSLHPFTNIRSAVLKLHAIRFATHQEAHHVAIDHANIFQIQNDVVAVRMGFLKSPQLGYRLCIDSATQDEHPDRPSRRSLDPESHRSAHIVVAAVPHCTLSIRALLTSSASRIPIGI